MAEPHPSRIVPILLVVVVLVVAGVGTALLYEFNHPKSAKPPRTVVTGDNVTVNYVGLFASGPQAGRIFDTSLYAIATNNASYPKALEFSYRGSKAAYTPLAVHVGPSAPSGGYSLDNQSFGSVVPGFWQGLLGLPVNHTKWITFPDSLGYGPLNSSCLATSPLAFSVPVLKVVSPSTFNDSYPTANPTPGAEFPDPTYQWTDLVLSVNATAIVVENLPPLGWSVPGASWPVVVTAINATSITVTNELTPANDGMVRATSSTAGLCGSNTFIVTSVDLADGTFTQDYAQEVVGQSLTFEVTVVQFY